MQSALDKGFNAFGRVFDRLHVTRDRTRDRKHLIHPSRRIFYQLPEKPVGPSDTLDSDDIVHEQLVVKKELRFRRRTSSVRKAAYASGDRLRMGQQLPNAFHIGNGSSIDRNIHGGFQPSWTPAPEPIALKQVCCVLDGGVRSPSGGWTPHQLRQEPLPLRCQVNGIPPELFVVWEPVRPIQIDERGDPPYPGEVLLALRLQ